MTQPSADVPTSATPDALPGMQLCEIIESIAVAQVVGVAARLGVADHLSSGPKSGEELARATSADHDVMPRFLRACVAVGLLEDAGHGLFTLTPLGNTLRSGGQSFRHLAITFTSPGFWLPSGRLFEAVTSGGAVAKSALGEDLSEYYRKHPEEGANFAAAMGEWSEGQAAEVTRAFGISRFRRIVEVGGSRGDLLAVLLEAAPGASGVLCDLPEVTSLAGDVFARRGLADRVEIVGKSFFDGVPPGGDLYVLKSVLCDWNDDQATEILRQCHRAAAPDSHLLVADMILPPADQPIASDYATLYVHDLLSLALTGGRLRTLAEFGELLGNAGYRLEQTVPISNGMTLIGAQRG